MHLNLLSIHLYRGEIVETFGWEHLYKLFAAFDRVPSPVIETYKGLTI